MYATGSSLGSTISPELTASVELSPHSVLELGKASKMSNLRQTPFSPLIRRYDLRKQGKFWLAERNTLLLRGQP